MPQVDDARNDEMLLQLSHATYMIVREQIVSELLFSPILFN